MAGQILPDPSAYREDAPVSGILDALISHTRAHLAFLDRDFNFMLVNDSYLKSSGYPLDELIGRNHFDLFPNAENQHIFEEVRRTGRPAYHKAKPFVFEGQLERGVTYWDWTLTPVKEADGLKGFVLSLTDVTSRVRMEHDLEFSQERYALAQRLASVGSWDWDFQTNKLFWSETVEAMFGFEPGEFQGDYHTFLGRVHPDDRDMLISAVDDCIKKGKPYDIRHRIVFPSGEIRWIAEIGNVFHNQDGKPVRMLGICRDVTEHKRTADERLRYLNKLDSLVHYSKAILKETTVQGFLSRVVEAGCDIIGAGKGLAGFGYKDDGFQAKAVRLHDGEESYEAENVAFEVQNGGIYLNLLQAPASLRLTDEQLRSHPDWNGLPKGHIELKGLLGNSLVGRQGTPTGMVMFSDKLAGEFTKEDESLLSQLSSLASLGLQHIISLQEVEEKAGEAREKKEILEALMEYIPEGVAIAYGPDVQIKMVSNHGLSMLERCPEDVTGILQKDHLKLWRLHDPENGPVDHVDKLPLSRAVLQEEVVSNEEWILKNSDREQNIPILCNAGPIRDHKGNVTGGIISWRDISEIKNYQRYLQKSLGEKTLLLQEIHHRVKNNLQIVNSLLSMSSRRTQDKPSLRLLTDIRSKIHCMALIHTQLYQQEDCTNINLGAFSRELYSQLAKMYKSDHITPRFDTDTIFVPMERAIPCGLVLNELFTNVFKHAFQEDEPGEMECTIKETSPGEVMIRVKDSGGGLPPGMDTENTETMGMKLIRSLVSHQLKGSWNMCCNRGTSVDISFKIIQ